MQYSERGCIHLGNQKKAVQTSQLFGSSLQSPSLHQNWLIFFVVVQHPHIPYALRCPCVYWYHFLLHVQYWNRFHTQWCKIFNFPGSLNKFEFVTPRVAEFRFFFTVPILVGNNRKTGLKWKQNSMAPRKCRYRIKNLKIIRVLQV